MAIHRTAVFSTSLMALFYSLRRCRLVLIYGRLFAEPRPPLGYLVTFHQNFILTANENDSVMFSVNLMV